jgi:predicted nucleic acid-binding Zn ribbon protein
MSSNDKPLKDVLREFVEVFSLKNKLNQCQVIDKWNEVVGPIIAKHTTNLYIQKKILFVEFDSSIVRNEIFLIKSKLIEELNRGFEKTVIETIILK